MTSIRLQQFSGIAPKISERLLPDNMATIANNLRLLSGELRGIKSPKVLHNFSDSSIKSSYRIPDSPDVWMGFSANDVDVVEGPLINDSHERYYWTGDSNNSYVTFNTLARIKAPSDPYRVGVPSPAALTINDITVPTANVISVSLTWPCVIGATGHPFAVDDVVDFSGVVGTDELNGNQYLITEVNTNDFTINVDATGYDTWISGGVIEEYSVVETRAYTYTYVNEYGEESAPADPVLASGHSGGTWELTGISASALPVDYALMTNRRVYRTVTGKDSSQYYLVVELNNSVTTYDDSLESSEVVQNTILNTWNWDVPPVALKGLVAHPSGFLVAFDGHELFCSERYRPHAWPTEYIIALNHDIVGLAIYSNTIVVLTTSQPYFIHGTHPSNLTPDKSDSVEPCLSKRSIVSTIQGVLYASSNGLVVFNQAGAAVATNSLISKDEWRTQFSPDTLYAAQQALQYLAFKDSGNGFEFSPAEPLGVLSTFDRFQGVDNIQTDQYNGKVRLMAGGIAYEWDATDQLPVYYKWASKVFDFPRPVNLGAAIAKLDASIASIPADELQDYIDWNTIRMGGAWGGGDPDGGDVANRTVNELHPMAYTPLASPRTLLAPVIDATKPNFPLSSDDLSGQDRRKYPIGGSPLFDATGLTTNPAEKSARLEVYADGVLIVTLNIIPNEMMRLPSGFKAHHWQFVIVSNANLFSLAVAETGKELKNV